MPRRQTSTNGDPGGHRELGPVLGFLRLVWAIDHQLQSVSKRMEARLRVTGPQRLVMRILQRFPGMSAGELADVLHLHPSTLTGVLRRLEERKLLTRRQDPEDARRALFRLTDRARAYVNARTGTAELAVRRTLDRLDDSQVGVARKVLATLAEELSRLE